MYRNVVLAALAVFAAAGCGVTSSPPLSPANDGVHTLTAVARQAVTLKWAPAAIKMVDAGPYVGTTLAYTHGDTLVVNYYHQCEYRVNFQAFTGPVKHGVETDTYYFYAYTGQNQKPYHCVVQAQLKDSGGHVIAQSNLAVTIVYPKQHPHGG